MEEDSVSQFDLFTFLDVPSSIKPFVRRIFYSNHESVNRTIRVAPTGYMYIGRLFAGMENAMTIERGDVMYLAKPPVNAVIGVLTANDFTAYCNGRHSQLLIELTPTAFYQLFHRDADALVDQMVDIAPYSRTLARAMSATPDCDNDIRRLLSAIEGWFQPLMAYKRNAPWVVTELARRLEETHGTLDLMATYEALRCSPRHAATMFRRVVGVRPKQFAMTRQINYLFELLASEEHAQFAAVAMEAGYGDQSHCIKALKRFISATPSAVLGDAEFATMKQYLATVSGSLKG